MNDRSYENNKQCKIKKLNKAEGPSFMPAKTTDWDDDVFSSLGFS